ncbi:MAG: Cold shock protein of CSP family, partial [uncultured Solirubrobacteraceae bacterium]
GYRNRQVVQRRQGLRLRHARRGRQGPLRPSHRHQRQRLQVARRGCPGVVRRRGRRQGPQGRQRHAAL